PPCAALFPYTTLFRSSMLGARPVAVVGSDEKAALVRELGAETLINRTNQDVAAAALEATNGEGVDAVYDAVGAATIEGSLRATKDRKSTRLNSSHVKI